MLCKRTVKTTYTTDVNEAWSSLLLLASSERIFQHTRTILSARYSRALHSTLNLFASGLEMLRTPRCSLGAENRKYILEPCGEVDSISVVSSSAYREVRHTIVVKPF
jgi:hypothetical protein